MIWPFHRTSSHPSSSKRRQAKPSPTSRRTWQLLQVEPSLACNLSCVMCPWRGEDGRSDGSGLMAESIWAAIRPWLADADMIDFTGGGEPLLHPDLPRWIEDAAEAGCRAGFLTNGTLLTTDQADRLIDGGLSWVGYSIDGATAEVYEAIRPGADFKHLCNAIDAMVRRKQGGRPEVILNFVMMRVNIHQLEPLVRMAADLGVDRINFKQCDVIRPVNGVANGLFASQRGKRVRALEKQVKTACRLAERLGLQTRTYAFSPDELPVCAQDPVHSLFIARNGAVSPCINTAYGGASRFFEKPVMLPQLSFGQLPDQTLMEIWRSTPCSAFRKRFSEREAAYNRVLASSQFEASLIKLEEAFQEARESMPPAEPCCRVCHYLYGV